MNCPSCGAQEMMRWNEKTYSFFACCAVSHKVAMKWLGSFRVPDPDPKPTVPARNEDGWIRCSERLPEPKNDSRDATEFLVTCQVEMWGNHVYQTSFDPKTRRFGMGGVIAWRPLPEPYGGEA